MPTFDLGRVRAALPALQECTYLNTGTFGLVAEPVAERALAALRAFDTRGMAAHDRTRPGPSEPADRRVVADGDLPVHVTEVS